MKPAGPSGATCFTPARKHSAAAAAANSPIWLTHPACLDRHYVPLYGAAC